MIFPLRERVLIRGCIEHIAANLGCGADYRAKFVPLYAPFKATVLRFSEWGGGNWIRFTRADAYRVEVAHLDRYTNGLPSTVNEGDRVAITGDTGAISSGPHAHIQCFDSQGRRVNPEVFFPNTPMNPYNDKIIRNQDSGAFAYVKDGKKQEFDNSNGSLALITFLDRLRDDVYPQTMIVTVSAAIWDSLPSTTSLFPPKS